MWALLDYDNTTVIDVISPDINKDTAVEIANGRTLVEMTLENSPGWIGGTYVDGKFYPPKELEMLGE